MTTLPTGEQLPEYDDEPRVDPATLLAWLRDHYPQTWGRASVADLNDGHALQPEQLAKLADYEVTIINQVVHALQAVSRATLVKNEMYRAMLRDRQELERLAAGITAVGLANRLLESDGNAVDTALSIITVAKRAGDAVNDLFPGLAARERK